MTVQCLVCNSDRRRAFNAVLLKKHAVDYYYCDSCGLLQTEKPYWLEEAYAQSIADADTGLVARNQSIARKLACLLYSCFDRDGCYIDVAGGYGMLTRLMRDIGFDFFWHDEYTENIFARGFEAGDSAASANAVTAFEVVEHLADPLDFIRQCLKNYQTRSFIFSTELFHGNPPAPNDWWYYTPDTGQHISFYQPRTLKYIAEKLSLRLYSHRNMHVLTDRKINPALFKMVVGRPSWFLATYVRARMRSLTFPDHHHICRQHVSADEP